MIKCINRVLKIGGNEVEPELEPPVDNRIGFTELLILLAGDFDLAVSTESVESLSADILEEEEDALSRDDDDESIDCRLD